jgi:CBS domain-containing protein
MGGQLEWTGALRALTAQSTLRDLGLRAGHRIDGASTVARAGAVMEHAGVSALLVDADVAGVGVGVVTERDIVRALAHGLDRDAPVTWAATWHPIVVEPGMTIVDAAATMLNEHLRHLLVDVDGTWAIVSLREITAVLLQSASPHLWLTSLRLAVESPSEIWLG